METIPGHVDEANRSIGVNEYYFIDTLPGADFDDVTCIASEICQVPLVSFGIIRGCDLLLKSCIGTELTVIPCKDEIIQHTIASHGELYIIPDLTKSNSLKNSQFLNSDPGIAFYAGISLVTTDGYVLGILSICDHKPRTLNAGQITALQRLAHNTVVLLELRKKNILLQKKQAELKTSYANHLEKFNTIASHDLKSPLNNIISISHLLQDDYAAKLDADGNEYITFIVDASHKLANMLDGIFHFSKASQLSLESKEHINITALIKEVINGTDIPANHLISYEKADREIYASQVILKQILTSLLHFVVNQNSRAAKMINLLVAEKDGFYFFEMKDNGPAIQEKDFKNIELFDTLRSSKEGSGSVDLSIVKRLVEKSGGQMSITSEITSGNTFTFSLPK